MSTVVTVKNTNAPGGASIRVVSQKVVDGGRELIPNGADDVEPGEARDFVIDAKQTILVIDLPQTAAEAAAPAKTPEVPA